MRVSKLLQKYKKPVCTILESISWVLWEKHADTGHGHTVSPTKEYPFVCHLATICVPHPPSLGKTARNVIFPILPGRGMDIQYGRRPMVAVQGQHPNSNVYSGRTAGINQRKWDALETTVQHAVHLPTQPTKNRETNSYATVTIAGQGTKNGHTVVCCLLYGKCLYYFSSSAISNAQLQISRQQTESVRPKCCVRGCRKQKNGKNLSAKPFLILS